VQRADVRATLGASALPGNASLCGAAFYSVFARNYLVSTLPLLPALLERIAVVVVRCDAVADTDQVVADGECAAPSTIWCARLWPPRMRCRVCSGRVPRPGHRSVFALSSGLVCVLITASRQGNRTVWVEGGQVAGYSQTVGALTHVLVRGSSHVVPYLQREAFGRLVQRVTHGRSLADRAPPVLPDAPAPPVNLSIGAWVGVTVASAAFGAGVALLAAWFVTLRRRRGYEPVPTGGAL
jgi:hypothetical protein